MKKYHVIIIGSGPSGLSTALNLSKNGIKNILVIDKSKFPRYKCCAGYITNQTKKEYEKLGLDIKKCNYSLIDNFKIYYNNKEKQIIKNKFLYTNEKINRVDLDYQLFKLAQNNKINIIENSVILKHNIDSNYIKLSNNQEYIYDYLVFADGTTGYGSKYQNTINKKKNIALQAIFPSKKNNSIEIHFGITKHGYAWISSYNGITNVGITDIFDKNINYKNILKEFISKNNLICTDENIKGCFTPIGLNNPIINNNIYFVGDALGACDPFTLSGLRYSIKSGENVAKSIKSKNNKYFIKYCRKINIKFKIMYIIQRIFYLKIVLNIVFNVMCKLLKNVIEYCFNNIFLSK